MEYTPFGGSQACGFGDGGTFNFTGDQFQIIFCGAANETSKTGELNCIAKKLKSYQGHFLRHVRSLHLFYKMGSTQTILNKKNGYNILTPVLNY